MPSSNKYVHTCYIHTQIQKHIRAQAHSISVFIPRVPHSKYTRAFTSNIKWRYSIGPECTLNLENQKNYKKKHEDNTQIEF